LMKGGIRDMIEKIKNKLDSDREERKRVAT
jgi:hypothetical protein